MKKIFFDIETQNTFQEVGSSDPRDLAISVVCIYDSSRDVFESYMHNELTNLWPHMEGADMLIGFNSDHFDLPLLNKYYPGDLTHIKSFDIMKEVKDVLGRRVKLESLAQGTLGSGKIAGGLDAITWWRNGEIEKIKKYCIEDVRITRDIYEYALKNKKLICKEGTNKFEIPLKTDTWEQHEKAALTSSMPW